MLFLTARRGRSFSGPVNSTVPVQSAVSAAGTVAAAAAGPASESEETSD